MSKTVDERVVEMRFDNKQFESNVQTSMSTIEKLKKSLDFRGAEKGLENLNAASKNVNMSGLSAGVEAVQARFSALQVIGVTALANITNSAVNSARRIVNAFTLQPITTGFNEYELKMGSVQTIMAATGESLETVNRYLNELNEYSDKTIYSFSDMTQNIGKFTNAGVKLEDAVTAIKGISNEAAVSGANANEASRAMYNFAQALSAGYVKLIDWKSIENANMATVEFKQQLIDSAVAMGTLIQRSDGMYQTLTGKTLNATHNFNDTLQEQWMTTDVLVSTLKMYADETTDIGKKAYASAQDVKTFSMMMDTLKEAAQSGWAQTWEIIWGDFEQGKQLWTSLSNIFSNIIGAIDNVRNNFLRKSLQVKSTDINSWNKLSKQVEKSGVKLSDFQDELKATAREHGIDVDGMINKNGSFEASLKENWLTGNMVVDTLKRMATGTKQASKSQEEMTAKLKYFQDVVDKVWFGSYYNGEERVKALTEAGYDYAAVQDLVNKTVDGHRLTLEDLGEEQLKAIGYTEEEIKALKDLASQAEKSGTSLNDLINSLEKKSGRELLTESFTHLWEELQKIFEEIKKSWDEVFPKEDDGADTWLYRMIQSFHDSVMAIEANGETLANVRDLFTGIYNALYLISALGKGPLGVLRMMWKVLKNLLQLDTLGLAARIGRLITAFKEWITKNNAITQSLFKSGNAIIDWVDDTTKAIVDWVNNFGKIKIAKDLVESFTNVCKRAWDGVKSWGGGFSKVFNDLKEALGSLSEYDPEKVGAAIRAFFIGLWQQIISLPGDIYNQFVGIGKNTVNGLNEGLQSGISGVIATITNIATSIIETIETILGIASPSKVAFAIGVFFILGLINGIAATNGQLKDIVKTICSTFTDMVPIVGDTFKTLSAKILEIIKKMNIDIQDVFVGGVLITLLLLANKFLNVINGFANPFKKLGGFFDSLKGITDTIKDRIKADKFRMYAESIKVIAEAIAILAAAVAGLTFVDQTKLLAAVGAIVALSAVVSGIILLVSKLPDKKGKAINFASVALMIASFGLAMLLISKAMEPLSSLDWTGWAKAIGAMVVVVIAMGGLIWAIGAYLGDATNSEAIARGSTSLIKIGVAVGIVAIVCKLMSGVTNEQVAKTVLSFAGLVAAFAAVCWVFGKLAKGKNAQNIDKAGGMILKLAIAIGILAYVAKLISQMEWGDIGKGLAFIGSMGLLFTAIIAVSAVAGKHANRAGNMLMKMALAIGLMIIVIKMIAGITNSDIEKGMQTIDEILSLFILFIGGIGVLTSFMPKMKDPSNMFLKLSASMILIATAVRVLGSIKQETIDKATNVMWSMVVMFGAVTIFSGFSGEYADKAGAMFLKMGAAILIFAAAITVLSLLKEDDVWRGAAIIAGFLGLFVLILKASSNALDASKDIIVMAACIGALVGIIALLTLLDPTKLANATLCVMGLMGMFAILVGVSSLAKSTWKGMATMLLVTAVLSAIIAALVQAPNIDKAIAAAQGISILLISMSAALTILSLVKGVSLEALGAMATLGIVVGELAAILGLIGKFNVAPSLETCAGLSILLLAMSGVTAILAAIGPIAGQAIIGAAAFAVVVGILGAVLVGLSELVKIATSSLPEIATNLSNFMENLGGFLAGAESIPSDLGTKMSSLAGGLKALMGLAVGDFWNSILTFGQGDLKSVGEKLVDFGGAMSEYAAATAGLNYKAIDDSVGAAKALVEVARAIPVNGGLVSLIAGDNDISKFGEKLVAFAGGLVGYSNVIAGLDASAITNMSTSAIAAGQLVEVANALKVEGGIGSLFSDDLTSFGSKLAPFGEGIKSYADSVRGLSEDDITTISNSATAAKGIVDVLNSFPKEGGWLENIFGATDFSSFETNIGYIADALGSYSFKISQSGSIDISAIRNSVEGAKLLVDVIKAFPKEGGWLEEVIGATDFSTFGQKVGYIADALVSYSSKITSNDVNYGGIETSSKAARALVDVVKAFPKEADWIEKIFGKQDFESFKTNVVYIADALVAYSSTISSGSVSADTINASSGSIEKLVGIIKKMSDIDSSAATKFKEAINTLASVNLKDFATTFSTDISGMNHAGLEIINKIVEGVESKSEAVTNAIKKVLESALEYMKEKYADFKSCGKSMIEKLSAGIDDKAEAASKSITTMCNGCISAINEYKANFYTIGKNLVQGFANGISANTWMAEANSRAMANAAKAAAKRALNEHSPSKEMYKIGDYAGAGFVNALLDYASEAYSASYDMASEAKNGLSKAISRISDIIDSDIDTQPTIRPVVDLSDVTSGVNAINGMMALNPSVGVMASVSSINASMNRKIQNGQNGDILNAIAGLNKTISNMSGDTYNVNGVTYDDGSNISEAVKAIIQAAKIDRRR